MNQASVSLTCFQPIIKKVDTKLCLQPPNSLSKSNVHDIPLLQEALNNTSKKTALQTMIWGSLNHSQNNCKPLKVIDLYFNSYSASRDNWCIVGGDGGCRVGEVQAGTTSPMPDHKSFKL